MKRRDFVAGLAGAAAWPMAAGAQGRSRVPILGVLITQSAPHPFTEALRAGMTELGYVEGRSIRYEWRYAEGQFERAAERAGELVRLGADVIAAHLSTAVRAAMTATRDVPIVMAPAGAPLQLGMVESLARPGGNVTGLSSMDAELGGKRLDLLRIADPSLQRVAVLGSRTDQYHKAFLADIEAAGARLGLRIQPMLIDAPTDIEAAFSAMAAAKTQAAVIQPLFRLHDATIVPLATKHRIAIMSSYRSLTLAGGLMSYSADHVAFFRRAASFVDRILKGAKPGDLPVEQPTKFYLVVNLKTAKALGLALSEAFLQTADEVIE